MRLKFFSIPALAPESGEAELNRFLDGHRVSHIERQFLADGAASFWAVCVTWVDSQAPAPAPAEAAKRSRVDYREVLGAGEFALYDRLRTLRKQMAEGDGLPPFAVFTNEQLAEMVRKRVVTQEALTAIDGVGDARLSRYGTAFLDILLDGVPRLAAPGAGGNA